MQLLTKRTRVDITVALIHDTMPLFPLPKVVNRACTLPSIGFETFPWPLHGKMIDENTPSRLKSIMICIDDLHKLASQLQLELDIHGDALWEDGEHTGFLINPVAHRILGHRPYTPLRSMTQADLVSEVFRLAAIIWIIQVKRRCRSYPGTATAHISKLLTMLSGDSLNGNFWNSAELQATRLWLLVLCSISEPSNEDLVTARRMIAGEMTEPRVISWHEVMADIRHMPWLEIFEPLCAELGQRLLSDGLQTPTPSHTLSTTLWNCGPISATESLGSV